MVVLTSQTQPIYCRDLGTGIHLSRLWGFSTSEMLESYEWDGALVSVM